MRRCRLWRRASGWLAPLLGLATPAHADPVAGWPAVPEANGASDREHATVPVGPHETLVLAVTLDGKPADEPLVAHRLGRELWVNAKDLRRVGVMLPRGTIGEIRLASVAAIRFTIDEARQSLDLESVSAGPPTLSLRPAGRSVAPDGMAPARAWGGFVNYDMTVYREGAGSGAGGTLEATVFSPAGYAFAGAIVRKPAIGAANVERTDIGYTFDNRDRLASLTLGDFINAASSFSRPIRMAGARIGTDFSLRPDLVTFPVPTVTGTAAVPTAVDVLVNGDRQAAGDVRTGRFAVSDVPVQTGVNTITVATRDALGRPVLQTVTTYASRELLRPGLLAFSGEAGWLRTGYLTADDRYRAFAVSGTVRRGMTDALTLETHGEAVRSMAGMGVGASLGLGRLGLLDAAVAISRDDTMGRSASQFSVGFERIARPANLSARYTRNTAGWSDLAGRYGSVTRSHSLLLNIGFDLGRFGTLSTSVVDLGRGTASFGLDGEYLRRSSISTRPATLLNATYTARLVRHMGLVANVGVDARARGSVFASVGALILFGSRTSGYAGAQRQSGQDGASISLTRAPIEQEQWGYRLTASTGRVDQAGAAVQYLGRSGEVQASVETVGGHVDGQVSARGSVGLAGGHAFAADTMTNSFAVIETRGQGRLAIYQDNRRIGTTSAEGILVAPNLPAYEKIKFSIDPVDVAASVEVERADVFVSLPRRSGYTVSFDLRPNRARLFRLVDADGRSIPPGSTATITGKTYPVGIDGILYAAPPAARAGASDFQITLSDGSICRAPVSQGMAATARPVAVVCVAAAKATTIATR